MVNQFKSRWMASRLNGALKAMPAVVLTGARQAGKTTLARVCGAGRSYLSLDDMGVLRQAKDDPSSLLFNRPLTLDEVQRSPELLTAVKVEIDNERRPGDFLITGSANLLLMGQSAESLAGRAVYLELPPFCPQEWLGKDDAPAILDRLFDPSFEQADWPSGIRGDWIHWLLRGGYASVLEMNNAEARDFWFTGYIQTYLERDLRQLTDVSNLPDFQKMMSLLANRTGRLLNQSEIARDAGLAQPTAHRYINLLETGFLITRIAPYASNPTTALVKSRKIFWNDCGLAAWLAHIGNRESPALRIASGAWLEQTLFQTLQAWRSLDPGKRRIHFWRDRSGKEVDFLLEREGKLVAIEVKSSHTVSTDDLRGIEAFHSQLPKKDLLVRGVVLHAGDARNLGKNRHALPWNWLVPEMI